MTKDERPMTMVQGIASDPECSTDSGEEEQEEFRG